ncbi:putative insecticidal toxin [Linnemannia gamsii]|uniref:Insecticidal toxin n=1 Tax=Linnemannia gamsii TaxID=64522 RepID=A0ABQ7K8G3_9FUNG|nr:putative insecticidal toxin [Linnemannia gamsii]
MTRALKGSLLRVEVYALDSETTPYTVEELRYGPQAWRLALPAEFCSYALQFEGMATPQSYESLRQANSLLDSTRPRTLTGYRVTHYVNAQQDDAPTIEGLVDHIESAELDVKALAAYAASPGISTTHIQYDAYQCYVVEITDAANNRTQAQYDYRRQAPIHITDPNGNVQEAAYDALGRLLATSFYGHENGQPVGFAPLSDDLRGLTTLESALQNPKEALGKAATVHYYDAFSWHDHKIPIHSATLMADRYPGDTEMQIRIALEYTDGFGRVLQSKQQVDAGPAYRRDAQGNLALINGQPIEREAATRWAVSGQVEYNNKGLPVRTYQPYFIDTYRYVNDASFRQFGCGETHYYDPLGREVKTVTAQGYLRRHVYCAWYTIQEDENDMLADEFTRSEVDVTAAIMLSEQQRKQISALCQHTPTLTVFDARGLRVREVQYNRSSAHEAPDERVTQHQYDAAGRLHSSIDPRLGKQCLEKPKPQPNWVTRYSLSGRVLRTDSVDAGWRAQSFDAAGRPMQRFDGRSTQQRFEYDALSRPTAIYETVNNHEACVERFTYGDNGVVEEAEPRNLRGQLIRHDDLVGTREIGSYALTGQPLTETQRFLSGTESPDWLPDSAARDALLEKDLYTTVWRYDIQGKILTQTDAKGHTQRFVYNLSGQLRASFLILSGQPEQCLVSDVAYNAFGRPLSETVGNGVHITYNYDPATQCFTRNYVQRADQTVLQDLCYAYDPVGNVVRIEDQAQAIHYANAQKIDPACNLLATQHQGAQSYTLAMQVAPTSNCAVSQQPDQLIDVAAYFDANGNPLQLQSGQPLAWDARNQLQQVVLIHRENGVDDVERYDYNGSGQRKPDEIENDTIRYSMDDHLGSSLLELDREGNKLTYEEYYPFGGTALWSGVG